MVVIIEGLDGTGKTTLCNRLCSRYDFKYIKGSYTDSLEEKKRRMIDLLTRILDKDNNYIYDRITFIDDFVYTVLNKEQNQLDEYFNIIQQLLSHCKVFHLVVDEEVRKERFNNRGDDFVTNDMLKIVDKEYSNYYKRLGDGIVTRYNLTGDLDTDVDNIIKMIEI